MKNSKDLNPPKKGKGDTAHTAVATSLAAIPVIGGSAAEIFKAIFIPPIEKRNSEWRESVAEGLRRLAKEISDFKIEQLSKDESFITAALHASEAAIRNHQKEKLEALRNAVLNAALPNSPDDDLMLMFIHFVDILTPWHLTLLSFFNDPKEWGNIHNIVYPDWNSGGGSTVLEHAFPQLKGQSEFYIQLTSDLSIRGLISGTHFLQTMMTPDGMFTSRTTNMGKKFIQFIKNPFKDE